MGSRFFFPESESAAVSPTVNTTDWVGAGAVVRRRLSLTKGSSANAAGTTRTVGTSRPTIDRQYVSDPLAAQTISGTIKGQLKVREFNATDNVDRLQMKAYVVSNDGSTVRGTLLAIGTYGVQAEFLSSGMGNKALADGDSLTSVDAQDGDRLVVEIGFGQSAAGTTPEAAANWGESAIAAPETEDASPSSDASGWVEFSGTVTLKNPGAATIGEAPDMAAAGSPVVSGTAAVTVGEAPSVSAAGSATAVGGVITGGEAPNVAAAGSPIVRGSGAITVGECPVVAGYPPAADIHGIATLEIVHLHRFLGSDGATPTQYTASGGSTSQATAGALTESSGTWIGALVRWDTGSNAGMFSSVAGSSSGSITFDDVLPTAVASGDKFTLFAGGKYASSEHVLDLAASALRNVTGFTLVRASPVNGEGTGSLTYDSADATLLWTPPGEPAGVPADASRIVPGGRVVVIGGGDSIEQKSKWILLERNEEDLPASDVTDDVSLDVRPGAFVPRVMGQAAAAGSVTFRAFGLRNGGPDPVLAAKLYCAEPLPGVTAAALASDLGTGAGTLEADDLDGWGSSGWVYNATKGDLRYYYDRSGNSALVLSPGAGVRGFTAVAWDDGDVLESYPWIDIGLDYAASGNEFENPAAITSSPSGVTFTCPRTAAVGLSIGTLASAAVAAAWMRITIPAGARPIEGARIEVRMRANVAVET